MRKVAIAATLLSLAFVGGAATQAPANPVSGAATGAAAAGPVGAAVGAATGAAAGAVAGTVGAIGTVLGAPSTGGGAWRGRSGGIGGRHDTRSQVTLRRL